MAKTSGKELGGTYPLQHVAPLIRHTRIRLYQSKESQMGDHSYFWRSLLIVGYNFEVTQNEQLAWEVALDEVGLV